MKKSIVVMLVIGLGFILSGCGTNEEYDPHFIDEGYTLNQGGNVEDNRNNPVGEVDDLTVGNDDVKSFNTEAQLLEALPFVATDNFAVSTVSADVDTAAYSTIRRILREGNLPARNYIRIEEMVNYFDYELNGPDEGEVVGVTKEMASAPWNPDHQLLMIGLKTEEIDFEEVPANNLVFLLDVSGSMNNSDKLPLLKNAMKMLLTQLRPEDKISIVTYAGNAGLVLDGADGNNHDEITAALDSLSPGGSTAGSAGIELAYEVATRHFIEGGNNRVILGTDGDFNVGISSMNDLKAFIAEKRDTGIFLSVLGFGSNHRDSIMETLADEGNGVYSYIDSILEAKKVFMNELGASLITVAKDVKIQIEFNPAVVKGYRLIGYENRVLDYDDFDDDNKDAGDLGAGHEVVFFYEIIPAGSDEEIDLFDFEQVEDLKYDGSNLLDEVANIDMRYKDPESDSSKLFNEVVYVSDATENPSLDFNFASSVVEFGMLLRDSVFKYDSSYQSVLDRATDSLGEDQHGYREEFLLLVEKAMLLEGILD